MILNISFQLENSPLVGILLISQLALKFKILLIALFDRQMQAIDNILCLPSVCILLGFNTRCSLRTSHLALIKLTFLLSHYLLQLFILRPIELKSFLQRTYLFHFYGKFHDFGFIAKSQRLDFLLFVFLLNFKLFSHHLVLLFIDFCVLIELRSNIGMIYFVI